MWFGNNNNKPVEVFLVGQDVNVTNISTISGLTMEQILDKMVDKKIGIAGSSSRGGVGHTDYSDIISGGALVLGANVTMGGYDWIVCHVDYDGGIIYLIKTYVEETVKFGSNVNYYGSTIAAKCNTFLSDLPSVVQSKLLTISVFGVNSKVFIPKASWFGPVVDGTTTTLSDTTAGKWNLFDTNSARIAYNKSGSAQWYWTSSPLSSSDVWYVNGVGALNSTYPSITRGFRPCVALAL